MKHIDIFVPTPSEPRERALQSQGPRSDQHSNPRNNRIPVESGFGVNILELCNFIKIQCP